MSIKIRHFVKGEPLDGVLKTGFEEGDMPEWIWCAERDGKVVAVLIAAPAHVVAILLRVASTPEAMVNDVRILLVTALNEMKERGFLAYVTWLNPARPNEGALMRIIEAGGGIRAAEEQVLCGGRV